MGERGQRKGFEGGGGGLSFNEHAHCWNTFQSGRKMGESGRKMAETKEKNGTKYPLFTVSFSQFFPEIEGFCTVPFVNYYVTALTDGYVGQSSTLRHLPPQQLTRTARCVSAQPRLALGI